MLCPNITPFGQNNLVLKVEFGKLVLDDILKELFLDVCRR